MECVMGKEEQPYFSCRQGYFIYFKQRNNMWNKFKYNTFIKHTINILLNFLLKF